MTYDNIHEAVFLDRPNRFIAHILLNGQKQVCHVKNTGRCRELLLPGAEIFVQRAANPARKTAYDLIAVYKEGLGLVNIDSQAPNQVVKEWLKGQEFTIVRPEYRYGDSRIDFYMEKEDRKYLMEVKGCTLERDGIGYFPDAPTERGVKHLHGLARCVAEGYEAYAVFVIQMRHVRYFAPAWEKHREFGLALQEAAAAGVHVLALDCDVTEHSLTIADAVPIDLSTPD